MGWTTSRPVHTDLAEAILEVPLSGAGTPGLPACVVVGAGVLGVCVALRLAEAGVAVTLLERDRPGQGSTRSSLAWLNANDKLPRAYHDLNYAGMARWAELSVSLGGPGWYRPTGNIEWASSRTGQAQLAARVDRLTRYGYRAQLIGAAQVAELEPALRLPRPVDEAAWFPDEGYLITEPLVSHLVALAVRRGVTLLAGEQGRLVGLDVAGNRVRAVRTATGQTIDVETVVCCGGRWVPELSEMSGAAGPVPLLPWAARGAVTPALVVLAGPVKPPGPARLIHGPDICLRPDGDGLVHLEAADAAVDMHTPQVELRRWATVLLSRAQRVVAGLEDAEVLDYRVCVRPIPVDGKPITGWLPGADGLYVAVMHSGVTLGLHMAELICAELVSGTPAAELAPYRPDRFTASA
jgi:glycine/D-amino acid oxidase-like deaminating enzyme